MAATVKIVRRPELTFWEKLYIPQILCGLKITFRHFFRNLYLHIAHRVGRLEHLPASITIQYPDEQMPIPDRYRGIHYLEQDKCIECHACERACPHDALKRVNMRDLKPVQKWFNP